MSAPRTAIVLPARFASTRFPGKPLAVIRSRPLIEWVHRRASEIRGVETIVVATDDDRIASAVRAFGGDVVMTSSTHATGTDRVAEVARQLDHDIIVNLQGDEPVFSPTLIEQMIAAVGRVRGKASHATQGRVRRKTSHATQARNVDIVTACHAISDDAEISNPHVVKVVRDAQGDAMYFSRSPIPHASDTVLRHIGIYVFQRTSLLRFSELARTPLEQAESLEQLRALENGMTIHVVITHDATVGVDVPDDIKNVEKALGSALD